MAKLTKTAIDKALRDAIFDDLMLDGGHYFDYQKINDRQYGVLLTDLNGVQRYVRIGAIVAEERDDMTAEELMIPKSKCTRTNRKPKQKRQRKRKPRLPRTKPRVKRQRREQKHESIHDYSSHSFLL